MQKIGVLGAGTMGAGIAQAFAAAGLECGLAGCFGGPRQWRS